MWTNVLVSKNVEDINLLKNRLKQEKIMVRIRKIMGESNISYEVLVPHTEVNDALNLIIDLNL